MRRSVTQGNVVSFERAAANRRVRNAIEESVEPYLETGERVRRVLLARTAPPAWWPIERIGLLIRAFRRVVVVATDRHLYVLRRRAGRRLRVTGVAWKEVRRPSTLVSVDGAAVRIGSTLYLCSRPSGPAEARDLVAFVEGDARFLGRPVSAQNRPI